MYTHRKKGRRRTYSEQAQKEPGDSNRLWVAMETGRERERERKREREKEKEREDRIGRQSSLSPRQKISQSTVRVKQTRT